MYGSPHESVLVAVVVPKKAFTDKYPDLASKEAQQAMLAVSGAGCGCWGAGVGVLRQAQGGPFGPVAATAFNALPVAHSTLSRTPFVLEAAATQQAKPLRPACWPC